MVQSAWVEIRVVAGRSQKGGLLVDVGQGESECAGYGGSGREVLGCCVGHERGEGLKEGIADKAERAVRICVDSGGEIVAIHRIWQLDIVRDTIVLLGRAEAICSRGSWRNRIEIGSLLGVACNYSHLIGMVEGEMGVDEDKEVGDRSRERKGWVEQGPGMGVGVQDDGQQGGNRFCKNASDCTLHIFSASWVK